MKKVAILLLAILIFSCSDDDEKGTVENKGQWAMISMNPSRTIQTL